MQDPNISLTHSSWWTCHVCHFARYQVSQQMYTTLPWHPCILTDLLVQSSHLAQIRSCVLSGDFALDATVFLPTYIWIFCALYSEYANWDCKLNTHAIICTTTRMYIYFWPIFLCTSISDLVPLDCISHLNWFKFGLPPYFWLRYLTIFSSLKNFSTLKF